jgi:hypothetical protein
MHHNRNPSECLDYYCDAGNGCGQSCAEIDIQEGNKFSWRSSLHGSGDYDGLGKGVGGGGADWSGPRDWSTAEYGPNASCIDTSKPFQVEAGFPADADCQLIAMEITLSQATRSDCKLKLAIDSYAGMAEMSKALAAGMTPVVNYWNSADMLWMDGKGADGQGPCGTDKPDQCSNRTKFSNFSVVAIPGSKCKAKLTNQVPAWPQVVETDAKESIVTTTTFLPTTTTLLTGKGIGGFAVTGPFGFLAGVVCVALIYVVMVYIRRRQSHQTSEKPTRRTLQRMVTSSNSSLASLEPIAEQRELEQQA